NLSLALVPCILSFRPPRSSTRFPYTTLFRSWRRTGRNDFETEFCTYCDPIGNRSSYFQYGRRRWSAESRTREKRYAMHSTRGTFGFEEKLAGYGEFDYRTCESR